MAKKDYYGILGLTKSATDDDIKKAYRKLASRYHPDKYQDEDPEKAKAEEKFKEAKEAYETLSDPQRRYIFDSGGNSNDSWSSRTEDQKTKEFEEIFKAMFSRGDFRFDEASFQRSKPSTPTFGIHISLADAYVGKSIKVDATTTVNVPRGVRSGTKLYVNGKMFRVDVSQHPKFKRTNDDLLIDIEITAIEAILGINATLEHLDGSKLQFMIPPGIQPGQVIRLSGKGMKNPEFDRIGDLHIRISIRIPKDLSEPEITSLKTIARRETIAI